MSAERRVKAGLHRDSEGNPKVFTLRLGEEQITLEPKKSWTALDHYKWVVRGLMEEPNAFHVLADGVVEISGEKIGPHDPNSTEKLEHEINKRHTAPQAAPKPAGPLSGAGAAELAPAHPNDRVWFKVKLDHFGHLMIQAHRGQEWVETGLRGLPGLVTNGFMLRPSNMHVDPLQRGIEIDGRNFESSDSGAHKLEEALNAGYAAKIESHDAAIEITENPAAATGFDIHFLTIRSGVRFDVKGHLTQERLDILQDPAKSELLQPGIVLRLSPPSLLIRRRRPDGAEERIPEIPDIHYRRVSAIQLQQMLNSPLLRRGVGAVTTPALANAAAPAANKAPVEIRVTRNPQQRMWLWIECVRPGAVEGKALTHHNMAELQHAGIFREHLDVVLSLDNRKLSILDKQTKDEESITIDPQSSDQDLERTGQMLTRALKPAPA